MRSACASADGPVPSWLSACFVFVAWMLKEGRDEMNAQLEIFWILSCKMRSLKWAVTSVVPAISNILSRTVRFLERWLASYFNILATG